MTYAAAELNGDRRKRGVSFLCPRSTRRAHGKKWNFVLNNLFPQKLKCETGSLECYSAPIPTAYANERSPVIALSSRNFVLFPTEPMRIQ